MFSIRIPNLLTIYFIINLFFSRESEKPTLFKHYFILSDETVIVSVIVQTQHELLIESKFHFPKRLIDRSLWIHSSIQIVNINSCLLNQYCYFWIRSTLIRNITIITFLYLHTKWSSLLCILIIILNYELVFQCFIIWTK